MRGSVLSTAADKESLGHLTDSAVKNQQRFVRACSNTAAEFYRTRLRPEPLYSRLIILFAPDALED